jgi:N6-adenosine-specific RNA methylase IME4
MEIVMAKTYDIIYADPPWDYAGQTQHGGAGSPDSGGALKHYPTMTLQEMIDQIVVPAEDNSLLYMWTSSPHLDQAIQLGVGWGFKYATVAFVWHKGKTNPGFYTMSQCELCLVFKRGKIPTPRGSRNERQFLQETRTVHSKKPDEIRRRIERMHPQQTRYEMFARQVTPGWDCEGNQTNTFEYNTKYEELFVEL